MSDLRYVKLKRGNDWGVEYFERCGTVRPHGTCSRARDAIKALPGQRVHVRFADGECAVVALTLMSRTETVHDHGHSYDVTSKLPAIAERTAHGFVVMVPLDAVEVAVGEDGELAKVEHE